MHISSRLSSAEFIYPFYFEAETFAARCSHFSQAAPAGSWQWEKLNFDDEELLPHIADYLNPRHDECAASALLWRLKPGPQYQPQEQWTLFYRDRQLPWLLDRVTLVLFAWGVGLLCLRVHPVSDEAGDWLDLLHHGRLTHGQRGTGVAAPARGENAPPPQHLSTFLHGLLQAPGEARWWQRAYVPGRLLCYSIVYVEDAAEGEREEFLYRSRRFFNASQEIHPPAEELAADYAALMPYAAGQWFSFSLEGGTFVAFDAPGDNGSGYFRHTLRKGLRKHYFLLFVLTLAQRFSLLKLSARVAKAWPPRKREQHEKHDVAKRAEIEKLDEIRQQDFDQLREDLLTFSARGYFTHVMQREHHHRYYARWQEFYQLPELYREVGYEVNEMHGYLLMRRTRQIAEAQKAQDQRLENVQWRVSVLGVAIGWPALCLTFLGINLRGLTSGQGLDAGAALIWCVVFTAFAVPLTLLGLHRWRR